MPAIPSITCAHFAALAIALAFLVLTARPAAALKVNATLDPCDTSDDCRLGLLCLRPQGDALSICYGFKKDKGNCKCLPSAPVTCTATSGNCPPGEGCATSRKTGNSFCVSCNLILDPNSNYAAFNGSPVCINSPTPLPTPSKSPGPPRAKFDLCSDDDPCQSSYICASLNGDLCTYGEPPCYCVEKKKKDQKSCSSSEQCPNHEEACLKFTVDNSTSCGSCTILKTHPYYIPVDPQDSKCDDVPLRKQPTYLPSDGFAGSDCFSDKQCEKPYRCLSAPNTLCSKKDFICFCRNLDKGPQNCTDTSECRTGELCARRRQMTYATCTSVALYLQSAAGIFQVLGNFPERGPKTSYDTCKMDYDCADGLYCTHLSENRIGGCFGRKGCVCEPPQPVQCGSFGDCKENEACATVPDSQQEPECYSKFALWKDPYFQKLSKKALKPTPTVLPTDGWTYDACSKNADCKQDKARVCRHFSERKGLCMGRRMCNCQPKKKKDGKCTSSVQCSDGEICAIIKNSRLYNKGSCVSKKVLRIKAYAALYVEVGEDYRKPLPSVSPGIRSSKRHGAASCLRMVRPIQLW